MCVARSCVTFHAKYNKYVRGIVQKYNVYVTGFVTLWPFVKGDASQITSRTRSARDCIFANNVNCFALFLFIYI